MSKLWIFGDSFSGSSARQYPPAWTQILSEKFIEKNYYVSSKPSRDFQTILDIFLKNLKNISKDDFVIIVVPTLQRGRLPLIIPQFDYELFSDDRFELLKKNLDYFIGAASYVLEDSTRQLEFPLTGIHEQVVNKSLDIVRIINASEASKKNYLEIINSLVLYLPFKIYFWSWTDELESELIDNKTNIKNQIGFWHVLDDEYKESGGISGKIGDHHFSPKMHKAFADYLIVKFPQFFNL